MDIDCARRAICKKEKKLRGRSHTIVFEFFSSVLKKIFTLGEKIAVTHKNVPLGKFFFGPPKKIFPSQPEVTGDRLWEFFFGWGQFSVTVWECPLGVPLQCMAQKHKNFQFFFHIYIFHL